VSARRPQDVPEPIVTVIDGFTHGGEGVARVDGKAVFVPGTLPGERVSIRIVDDRRRWARAALIDVLTASPDRVAPPCPYVPDCGGCDLQHATPDAQRRLKTRVVREQLERLGGIAKPPVADCRAVGPALGYRSHVQMHAAPDGRLGFRRASSHDVVPVERCLVARDEIQQLRELVGDATGASRVAFRVHGGRSAVVLTPSSGGLDLPEGEFDLLLEQPDGGVVAIRGHRTLVEDIAGVSLRFPADAFFQASPEGAAALVGTVLEAAGSVTGALVWDLYAGVGLLSLPLARAGAAVIAVEAHPGAAAAADANATEHGLDIEVVHATVEEALAHGAPGLDPPDVVVLDPPRRGAGAEVVEALVDHAPETIVYVACDPAALARDARSLVDGGYRLTAAVPLDLFPMTHHVEVVATFRR
jgi:23S rRNA (uracil1939-C5)-methyltransferase